MAISERIQQIGTNLYEGVANTGAALKRGVLRAGDECSQSLHDVYSMEGFEKLTKSLIASLKFVSLIPAVNGVFAECIKTFEAQKDIYQATKVISSTAEYIHETDGRLSIKLENKKGEIEKPKLLYAIGNVFETLKFVQKCGIIAFSTCTKLSNTYGAVKVFNKRLDDIPVFGSLFDKPKEFFVFWASLLETSASYEKTNKTWEELLKMTASTGRMFLVFFGKHFNSAWWFMLIDVVTQNANFVATIIKCRQKREARLNNL